MSARVDCKCFPGCHIPACPNYKFGTLGDRAPLPPQTTRRGGRPAVPGVGGSNMRISDQTVAFPSPARGGNVIFQAGAGWVPKGSDEQPEHGSFIWRLADGTEILRIDGDGKFSIRGEDVRHDEDIYNTFSEWLYQRPHE